ncbi:hypothetical protein [Georgenia sp. SYP-B2076]|uniref:hypothetical protein n=1 Tax=Georgenia sp. SYP-B2076 TaxID=2495881 RepID=UPI000F8D6309|nr:hypothetical protein [Georgenia sp. SYP-B2076]
MSTPTTIRPPAAHRRVRDTLRRERYLLNLQFWLDAYPARQRRGLVRQLRGDLDAAATDASMAEAIASLGDARALAREYLALLPRDRPRWQVGAAWAAGWLVAWGIAVLGFLAALFQVAADAGPEGVRAGLLWFGVTVVNTDAEVSLAGHTDFPWGVGIAVVVFLVVARAWRVVPALRPPRAG